MAQLLVNPDYPIPPNPAALRPRQGLEALIPTFRVPTPEEITQSRQNVDRALRDPIRSGVRTFYDFLKSNIVSPTYEALGGYGRRVQRAADYLMDQTIGREPSADDRNIQAQLEYAASRREGEHGDLMRRASQNTLAQMIAAPSTPSEAGRTPPIVPPSDQNPNIVWNGERPLQPGGIAGWWQRMSQQPGFKRGLAAFGKSMAESRPGFLGALNAATHGIANAQDVMEASRLGERELALKEALANAQIGHYQAQAANYKNQVLQAEREYQEKLSDNERQARTTALNNAIQISKDNPLLAEKINILVQQGYLNEDGALVDSSPETVAAIASSLGDTYLNIAKKLEPYISSKEPAKPAASPTPQGRRIAVIPGSTR